MGKERAVPLLIALATGNDAAAARLAVCALGEIGAERLTAGTPLAEEPRLNTSVCTMVRLSVLELLVERSPCGSWQSQHLGRLVGQVRLVPGMLAG